MARERIVLGVVLLLACDRDPNPRLVKELRTSTVEAARPADTTLVRTEDGSIWHRGPIVAGEFAAISDTMRVGRNARLAWANDSVIWVGDDNQLRAVTDRGEIRHRFGRNGEGPGEYRSVHGLYAWGEDSVLVWDGRTQRLTWVDSAGRVHRTMSSLPPENHSTAAYTELIPCNGGVTLAWTGGVIDAHGQPDTLILTQVSLSSGAAHEVLRLLGPPWTSTGLVAYPRDAYASRRLTAIGAGCRVATSIALTPCVTQSQVDNITSNPREACWWRTPAKRPWRAKRAGQLRGLGLATRDSGMLSQIMEGQSIGKYRTAIDAIRLDDQGRVWARATDRTTNLHPVVLGRAPEKRGPLADGDIIGADGRLLGTVQIPSRIDVAIRGSTIIGLRETEDGDFELVRAELPAVAR
jgi:hypothetical protein